MMQAVTKLSQKVDGDECKKHWNMQFESSAKTCSHAFWKVKL